MEITKLEVIDADKTLKARDTFDAQRSILYDVDWQSLRIGLLAENRNDGGFGSVAGVKANLKELETYVTEADLHSYDYKCRVYRVLNLLNATLLGYGSRMKGTDQEKLVVEARDHWSKIYAELGQINWEVVDWDDVYSELLHLIRHKNQVFLAIRSNLKKRVETAKRKEAEGTGGMQYRSELKKFLELMEKAQENYQRYREFTKVVDSRRPRHALQLYIQEAEHQDGYAYWDQFKDVDELLADYDLFLKAIDGAEAAESMDV